jgi:hypothetical protein
MSEWERQIGRATTEYCCESFGVPIGLRKVLGKPAHMYIVNSLLFQPMMAKSVLFDKSI